MNNPGFSPRQLEQLDQKLSSFSPAQLHQLDAILYHRRFSPSQLERIETILGQHELSARQLEQVDAIVAQAVERKFEEKLAPMSHDLKVMFEHYFGLTKALFDPVYAKLEAMDQMLTTVKPRVDMLVAAELSSRVGRLERKVFPPARSRRAPAKRSRGRRG